MRLAAFEDTIYHREDGVISTERAFPLFMAGLREHVDELVILGRLDPEPQRSHHELPADVEFVPLPFYPSLTDPLAVARALGGALARFWRVLGRVDALWINGPHPLALAVVPLALARGCRIVLGVRQNTMEYARNRHPGRRWAHAAFWLMEAAWRGLAKAFPVAAVGPELARLYGGSSRLLELSVSFVSERDLAAADLHAARRYDGEVTVLTVGRIDPEKNPLLLADVLAELIRRGRNVRLQVVGDGPLREELASRLRDLGVADNADLLGYVPVGPALFERYRAADLFLHVSWTEGFPQVLIEAFAARLPAVATDVGGIRAVADGAAVLIPAGDAGAAADAVERLLDDAGLRDALSAEGAERARARTVEAERRRLAAWMSET